jgi:hypothetical protein
MICAWCGSNDIRPSKRQSYDSMGLKFFEYPIRCRSCRQRSSVSVFWVLKYWLTPKGHRAKPMKSQSDQA